MIIDRFENHASIYSVDRPLDFVVVPPCCRKVFMHEPLGLLRLAPTTANRL